MPPVLGIGATEQLGVKTIDEHRTKTDTDTEQAQKSSRTNCTQTHTVVFHATQNWQYLNTTIMKPLPLF